MLGFQTLVTPLSSGGARHRGRHTTGASGSLSGARRRPPGSAGRVIVLTLLVAACGATVPPIVTSVPSNSRPPTGNLKRIRAMDATTVVFELSAPDVAFLSKIASPAFGINDAGWLQSHIDPKAAGYQAIFTEVNGIGPYRLEGWNDGAEISVARNDAYWGEKDANERLIVRWRDDPAQRVAELQGGIVDGIDDVDPLGVTTVVGDVSLGFTNTFAPFNNEKVRRAVAMGIDRQRIVERFFPPGSEVATHYAPCAIPHGCAGDRWYASTRSSPRRCSRLPAT